MRTDPRIIGERLPQCAAEHIVDVIQMYTGAVNRRTRRDIFLDAGRLRKQDLKKE